MKAVEPTEFAFDEFVGLSETWDEDVNCEWIAMASWDETHLDGLTAEY